MTDAPVPLAGAQPRGEAAPVAGGGGGAASPPPPAARRGRTSPLLPTLAVSESDGPPVRTRGRLSSNDWTRGADIGAIFGLDVGGSLAKLVFFERTAPPGIVRPPSASSLAKPTMERARSLEVLNTPACSKALRSFYDFMASEEITKYLGSVVHEDHLAFYSQDLGGMIHFVHFATSDMDRVLQLIRSHKLAHAVLRLGCTGGGSFKYQKEIEEQLGVQVVAVDEMETLVRGIEFVVSTVAGECYTYKLEGDEDAEEDKERDPLVEDGQGAEDEPTSAKKVSERWTAKVQRPAVALQDIFPYLLVSIGSGVSIVRVDGFNSYQRVSGSSIGGGTFFGLARLITGCSSYDELLKLAQCGDATKCDMLVGDIYGRTYSKIGLASDVVASSFGRLMSMPTEDIEQLTKPEDRARALLMMITNNIGQVAYLNAVQHNTSRIYFIGNFLRRNKISCHRLSYAIDYWSSSQMEARFLEHEGYFGALGAWILSASQEEDLPLPLGQSRATPPPSSPNGPHAPEPPA
mmetsp:Transcript_31672/g.92017  ORF Transcript_31672/g.92017 Transcript_31672/m.92017 type:complete len:519 (-) Transcript_31672:76-1632(-)